jgi:hypothetical protein
VSLEWAKEEDGQEEYCDEELGKDIIYLPPMHIT